MLHALRLGIAAVRAQESARTARVVETGMQDLRFPQEGVGTLSSAAGTAITDA
jgi:hypothetical protein